MSSHLQPFKMQYWFVCGVCFLILVSGVNASNQKESCGQNDKSLALLDMAEDTVNKAKLHFPAPIQQPFCSDVGKTSNLSSCGKHVKSLTYLEFTRKLISEAKGNLSTCRSCCERPRDCSEVLANGHNRSGVYTVYPVSRYTAAKSVEVLCDMETDGGGWTVIQRRGKFSPQQDFNLGWEEYKNGFGSFDREFWLGNKYIFALSNQGPCEIRFDLGVDKKDRRFAVYKNFRTEDESSSYTVRISGYSGNAGDSMGSHNNAGFSPKDRDIDGRANSHNGGWWYQGYSYNNPNGIYQLNMAHHKGIFWHSYRRWENLGFMEIRIRLK